MTQRFILNDPEQCILVGSVVVSEDIHVKGDQTVAGSSSFTGGVTAGNVSVATGNIEITTKGNFTSKEGNLVLTKGSAELTAGNLVLKSGTIDVKGTDLVGVWPNFSATDSLCIEKGHIAYQTLFLAGVPADGKTVTIGGSSYVFKAAPGAGEVASGASGTAACTNLAAAINGGTAGVPVLTDFVRADGYGVGLMSLYKSTATGTATASKGTLTLALATDVAGSSWTAANMNQSGRTAKTQAEEGEFVVDAVFAAQVAAGLPGFIYLGWLPTGISFSCYALVGAVRTWKEITDTLAAATINALTGINVVTGGATHIANGDIIHWRATRTL